MHGNAVLVCRRVDLDATVRFSVATWRSWAQVVERTSQHSGVRLHTSNPLRPAVA